LGWKVIGGGLLAVIVSGIAWYFFAAVRTQNKKDYLQFAGGCLALIGGTVAVVINLDKQSHSFDSNRRDSDRLKAEVAKRDEDLFLSATEMIFDPSKAVAGWELLLKLASREQDFVRSVLILAWEALASPHPPPAAPPMASNVQLAANRALRAMLDLVAAAAVGTFPPISMRCANRTLGDIDLRDRTIPEAVTIDLTGATVAGVLDLTGGVISGRIIGDSGTKIAGTLRLSRVRVRIPLAAGATALDFDGSQISGEIDLDDLAGNGNGPGPCDAVQAKVRFHRIQINGAKATLRLGGDHRCLKVDLAEPDLVDGLIDFSGSTWAASSVSVYNPVLVAGSLKLDQLTLADHSLLELNGLSETAGRSVLEQLTGMHLSDESTFALKKCRLSGDFEWTGWSLAVNSRLQLDRCSFAGSGITTIKTLAGIAAGQGWSGSSSYVEIVSPELNGDVTIFALGTDTTILSNLSVEVSGELKRPVDPSAALIVDLAPEAGRLAFHGSAATLFAKFNVHMSEVDLAGTIPLAGPPVRVQLPGPTCRQPATTGIPPTGWHADFSVYAE